MFLVSDMRVHPIQSHLDNLRFQRETYGFRIERIYFRVPLIPCASHTIIAPKEEPKAEASMPEDTETEIINNKWAILNER